MRRALLVAFGRATLVVAVCATTVAFAAGRALGARHPVAPDVPARIQVMPPVYPSDGASDFSANARVDPSLRYLLRTPLPAPRPSAPPSSVAGAGASLTQTIVVTILPGPFTIKPITVTLQLDQHGNGRHYTGTLPTFSIVDARGSLAGWTATLRLVSVDGANVNDVKVRVFPDRPVVVSGDGYGLHDDHPSDVTTTRDAALCHADAGDGGGTFTCGGHVDVNLSGHVKEHLHDLAITLQASVH